ncbi:Dak1-domain-containing protein [Aspergillus ibericus CBS 121593]|uniref:Dak1-domain-containing protein n=1 Tax=Aspergillus ibericus CBS 121593 TaxID=1448316 RepID=A0A395GZV1_9EURO|nr:Dak1-domain-containing protein [Aspergillus ibericus CBS 121593]RAL01121.1 Dak1-domain-containing protein [Aspergillus ibericus CBS 121593]
MATRHFIHDGATLVQDALHGLALSNPSIRYDDDIKAIINPRHDGDKQVTLISGGGAGHEPSFVGLVGDGLLSAAVSGFIFASPSVHQIQNTIARVGGSAGTLLVIMNYTGDVLHFHLAAEKARLAGFNTAVLVVGDDVSVGRQKSGKVGRRGLAGTVLVEKILGALAQQGMALEELRQAGEEVVNSLATVGAALDHVHLVGKPADPTDRTDQVEVGMGIHNEPGCYVVKPQPSISDLVDQMLDKLLDPDDADRAYVSFTDTNLCLLVNNLGGVSNIEFSAVTKTVVDRLDRRGLKPIRIYSGSFMTSLDGKGFSITLLKASPQMLEALDAPAITPGWSTRPRPDVDEHDLKTSIERACYKLIAAEAELDRYDSVVDWVQAAGEALQALRQATSARAGDRTIMDALEPFITALQAGASAAGAVDAARAGRNSTQGMTASFERAVYVPEEGWSRVPDPGAAGLVCLLEGLLSP